ncbi:hypothetical protein CORC01_12406 [Colletotrichum orchidophilum]|uniref:Uncharacterized protein n=1 Tax=Colletotrichum orchidophilum TaxID=1209926 RepID=A0A1G4AT60_9PEZI|nr:uncharacterized protein CORC01_12406 [Colletotrichum orchidophilum]OHE92291.1 hypothetical protein CORC01_12406 [Colletotrichum orchidophilum]
MQAVTKYPPQLPRSHIGQLRDCSQVRRIEFACPPFMPPTRAAPPSYMASVPKPSTSRIPTPSLLVSVMSRLCCLVGLAGHMHRHPGHYLCVCYQYDPRGTVVRLGHRECWTLVCPSCPTFHLDPSHDISVHQVQRKATLWMSKDAPLGPR